MSSSVHSFEDARSALLLSPLKTAGQVPLPSPTNGMRELISPRHVRRPSNTSTRSSIGGVLDSTPFTRTGPVAELGHNAISTLLQAPIVRTGLSTLSTNSSSGTSAALRAPTARDIPPVSLASAPHVDNSVFQDYLVKVTPLFKTLERARSTDDENQNQESGRDNGLLSPHSSVSSPADQLGRQRQTDRRRSSRGLTKPMVSITSLSTIPKIYFESDFRLENPRTFDIVSENSRLISQPASEKLDGSEDVDESQLERKTLATNTILQEKLSWYIETVETHLTASISVASTSFFAALDSLKTLQKEAEESVVLLKKLRGQLSDLDREMVTEGLEILELQKRKHNVQKLADSVEQLGSIMAGYAHCQSLIETHNFDQALDRLEDLQRFVAGQPPEADAGDCLWLNYAPSRRLYDLSGLDALVNLPAEMAQLKMSVGKAFESRFLSVLLEDLRRHSASVPPSETIQRWNQSYQRSRGLPGPRVKSGIPAYITTDEGFSTELSKCLQSLNRAGLSSHAAVAFKEAVMKEMKGVVRMNLPSSSDDAASVASFSTRHNGRDGTVTRQEKSQALSRNIVALDPHSAQELVINTYTSVGEVLRRLGVQIKVILDVTTGICLPQSRPPSEVVSRESFTSTDRKEMPLKTRQRSNSATLRDELGSILDISSLVGQGVDVAIYYITRVLRARNKPTVQLPLYYFLRYVSLNRLFLNECEAVSGRPGTAIMSLVDGQIREFIGVWAEHQRRELHRVMDVDQWAAVEIGPHEKRMLDRIVRCAQTDILEWTVDATQLSGESPSESGNQNDAEDAHEGEPGSGKSKNLFIGDSKYILVASSVRALQTIEDYCVLMTNISTLMTDICLNLLDFLKLFNSRSCQLILGAGATRSAGLASINTRHLAFAHLSLSFLIALMEHICSFTKRKLPPTSTLPQEFDKVKSLFQDHQMSIEEKLIDIMSSRSYLHASSMHDTDFDSEQEIGQETSGYMNTLTKETATLHRVLGRNLDGHTVTRMMSEVFARYREHWGHGFEAAVSRVRTRAGWNRLRRDAELFASKFGKLDEAGDLGSLVLGIVDAAAIADGHDGSYLPERNPGFDPTPEPRHDHGPGQGPPGETPGPVSDVGPEGDRLQLGDEEKSQPQNAKRNKDGHQEPGQEKEEKEDNGRAEVVDKAEAQDEPDVLFSAEQVPDLDSSLLGRQDERTPSSPGSVARTHSRVESTELTGAAEPPGRGDGKE